MANVGNDREISMNDLAKLIMERAGSSAGIKHIPYLQAYGEDFEDIRRRRPALEKLRGLTGFKHRFTLENTVDELIAAQRAKNMEIEHGNSTVVRHKSKHTA